MNPTRHPTTRVRPVIRLFVSSTFSDMRHERNALQQDVFPKLEQLCLRNGFQFHAIDLRWGVSSEAGLDHRTMRICFDELRRAQEISPKPNFLILLGNRYGWRPLPEEISVAEFATLERAAEELATTTDKSPAVVLREWYRQDENAVPPVYLFQTRRQELHDGKDYTQDAPWNEVQAVLWEIINRAMPPEQLQRRFDEATLAEGSPPPIVRFQASATEQEIWQGALRVPDAQEHVLAFFRQIENVNEFSDTTPIKDFVDLEPAGSIDPALPSEQERLKAALRVRLGEANEFEARVWLRKSPTQATADVTTDHLTQLCTDVENRMTLIIQGQIDEYWNQSAPTSPERTAQELTIEQDEHARFGRERGGADSFVGRETELQWIRDYLQNDSPWPLVVHGASGCGKTALLARAAEEIQGDGANNAVVMVRFIGVTPRSSDIRSLLGSLCQELRLWHPLESPIRDEVCELTKELSEHFNTATAKAPLILFLDALDQLAGADNGPSLFWIPQLPGHVKLVVSCLSDRSPEDPASQPYTALRRRGLADENFINLDALSEDEAKTVFFEHWLPQTKRNLNAEQALCIRERLKSDACRQPLYLKVLFEEARLWRSDDLAPSLGNNVSELIGALFKRLSEPSNHGPTLKCALGYIAAARRGLTEMEILEVLYQDPDYAKFLQQMTARTGHQLPDNSKRIPIAIWSRLRFDLSPYLTEHAAPGGTVLNFYHRQVAEFVRGQFLDTPSEKQNRHERLAGYFHDQNFFLESREDQRARAKRLPPTPRPVNVRKVDELPWQRLAAARLLGEWEAVEELFTDLFFLEAKAEAGMVFDLAGDFNGAANSVPTERSKRQILKLLAEGLRRDIHFISRHPTTVFQCLWNTCWWYDTPYAKQHYPLMPSIWNRLLITILFTGASCVLKLLCVFPGIRLHAPMLRDRIQSVCKLMWRQVYIPKSGIQNPDRIFEILERWHREKSQKTPVFYWLRSRRPPCFHLGAGMIAVIRACDNSVTSVCFTPDNLRIVGGFQDGNVGIFAADNFYFLSRLSGHSGPITSVACSLNGFYIASGSEDSSVRLWDARGGGILKCLNGHTGGITCLSISDNSRFIATGSADMTIRVWDVETGKQLHISNVRNGGVRSLQWSPDGCSIIALSGWHVRQWVVFEGAKILPLTYLKDYCGMYRISPCSERFAFDSATGYLKYGNIYGNSQDAHSRRDWLSQASVTCLSWSPDGKFIGAGYVDGSISVWDGKTGKELARFERHDDSVESLDWSIDGRRVVSGSRDGTIRLWDCDSQMQIAWIDGHRCPMSVIRFSPDGKRIATGADDSVDYAYVWDAERGVILARLDLKRRGGVTALVWSWNGRNIVSCSGSGLIQLWKADTGREVVILEGQESGRMSERDAILRWTLEWSGDSRIIIASRPEMARSAWNAETGECVELNDWSKGEDSKALSAPNIRFRLLVTADETVIVDALSRDEVAWFPFPLTKVTESPCEQCWAGASKQSNLHLELSHLFIVGIECG